MKKTLHYTTQGGTIKIIYFTGEDAFNPHQVLKCYHTYHFTTYGVHKITVKAFSELFLILFFSISSQFPTYCFSRCWKTKRFHARNGTIHHHNCKQDEKFRQNGQSQAVNDTMVTIRTMMSHSPTFISSLAFSLFCKTGLVFLSASQIDHHLHLLSLLNSI